MITKIYTDGGVCKKNPSPYGLSWGFLSLDENDTVVHEDSGRVTTADCKGYKASNNLAEMIAAIKGLEYVIDSLKETYIPLLTTYVTLYSDSELTLNRIFKNYSTDKLPKGVVNRLGTVIAKFRVAGVTLNGVLVGGHPTKKELKAGVNKKGLPVSEFNVRVDLLCKEQNKLLV